MPRGLQLQPVDLSPEWLTNSPVTADDFRCLTPASTIFRMSFGATSHSRHRESVVHSESDDEGSDASTFLWDDDESDSESEDDADTIEEPEPTPVASKPKPVTASPATPPHSRKSSTEHPSNRNCTARPLDFHRPWYMQVDPACLSSLDDQLLQSPLDAFADLCYAQAVRPSDLSAAETQVGHSYGYSWRRLSRLLSACPDLSPAALGLAGARTGAEQGRESESESDTDSEQLASPEQAVPASVPGWGLRVYQPKSEREQAESPYRPYASQPHIDIAKPLPALPSLPAYPAPSSPSPPHTPPPCSPPPLRPSDAVAQAQLAFLFAGAPPRDGESVHFFPTPTRVQPHPPKRSKSLGRRGTLRVSIGTRAMDGGWGGGGGGGSGNGGARPLSPRLGLFQRGLAGIRAGLSH